MVPAVGGESPGGGRSGGGWSGSRAALAVADLAGRLGVETSLVVVVSEEEVTWPDSSIGCPQPGMVYAQRLVEGVLIVLEVEGRRYEYHAGRASAPFYCPDPTPPLRRS